MKTLNDIRKHRIMDGTYNITEGTSLGGALDISEGATIHDLRQSAIEDIKELSYFNLSSIPDAEETARRLGKIEYIKEKFNITEDDLK